MTARSGLLRLFVVLAVTGAAGCDRGSVAAPTTSPAAPSVVTSTSAAATATSAATAPSAEASTSAPTAAPTTVATSAPTTAPTTAPTPVLGDPTLPADLQPLVDRSVMEPDVARQLFDRIAEVIGDPQGVQRIDAAFVTDGLTRLLNGEITPDGYFSHDRLPPTAAVDSLVINWLMCSESMGELCGGSLGNIVSDLMLCTNMAERRWAAAWVDLDGRFAAGVYCEYRPPAEQIAQFVARIDECVVAGLNGKGLDPRRADYLDSIAAEFAVIPADTPQEDLRNLLREHSARYGGRYIERRDVADEAVTTACTARLKDALADPEGFDGEYGIAVVVRERNYRIGYAFG